MMPQAPSASTPATIALREPSCHSRTPGGRRRKMDESVTSVVKRDSDQDSVRLMELTTRLQQVPGVEVASAMMGTAANKALFADAGLLTAEITAAGPGDLCIAIRASDTGFPPHITGDTAGAAAALRTIEAFLTDPAPRGRARPGGTARSRAGRG